MKLCLADALRLMWPRLSRFTVETVFDFRMCDVRLERVECEEYVEDRLLAKPSGQTSAQASRSTASLLIWCPLISPRKTGHTCSGKGFRFRPPDRFGGTLFYIFPIEKCTGQSFLAFRGRYRVFGVNGEFLFCCTED
jgi:hypothetical protein